VAAAVKLEYTVEKYLAMERASETKHEYVNGQIVAMAGATRKHNVIGTNISISLGTQLRRRPCELYSNDMRVQVREDGIYSYPDAVIVCGEPRFADKQFDTLLNPTVIIEVVSTSTEGYDRGEKFQQYRALDSLQQYVLVSQSRRLIDCLTRQDNDQWLLTSASHADAVLQLASIDCMLALADVYEKVMFGAE